VYSFSKIWGNISLRRKYTKKKNFFNRF